MPIHLSYLPLVLGIAVQTEHPLWAPADHEETSMKHERGPGTYPDEALKRPPAKSSPLSTTEETRSISQ